MGKMTTGTGRMVGKGAGKGMVAVTEKARL